MENNSQISINFNPLKEQTFSFKVYRKLRLENEKKETFSFEVRNEKLPTYTDPDDYKSFWVSFHEQDNFELFECQSHTNNQLTLAFLYEKLKDRCTKILNLNQFIIPKTNFTQRIFFITGEEKEGFHSVWVEPYYLKSEKVFGFLIDYSFTLRKGQLFNRKVQQLSGSLDKNFKSNQNFYAERYLKIKDFAIKYYNSVFKETIIDFGSQQNLTVNLLDDRKYLFSENKESYSRQDLKKLHPFEYVSQKPVICFYYKSTERQIIRDFYKGIQNIFIESFGLQIEFKGFLKEEISEDDLIKNIQQLPTDSTPIVILFQEAKNTDIYFKDKFLFTKNNIPIQVILYNTIQNTYSINNLALQIFCKLGGKPWCVKPSNQKCLIVGLAQAHQTEKKGDSYVISKYFSYSVLLDSSGLYKSLRVMGDSTNKNDYLSSLGKNLEEIIDEYGNEYEKVVIHTPFKLKFEELNKIKESLNKKKDLKIQFVVIRINTKNKFFGYLKEMNTLTPFENTYVKLSHSEYLVWFEGLLRNTPDPKPLKRYSSPTYIEFSYQSPIIEEESEKIKFLQEIINLAGANWRGFNAKSIPISIYYCSIISKFIKEFRMRKDEQMDFQNLKPWFL